MSEIALAAPEAEPIQTVSPPSFILADLRRQIMVNESMGTGGSHMTNLLRRAIEEIESLRRADADLPVKIFRGGTKYPCHPDCKRCARQRVVDVNSKRRRAQNKRSARR